MDIGEKRKAATERGGEGGKCIAGCFKPKGVLPCMEEKEEGEKSVTTRGRITSFDGGRGKKEKAKWKSVRKLQRENTF